jgi:hypothetical protein
MFREIWFDRASLDRAELAAKVFETSPEKQLLDAIFGVRQRR